MQNTTLEFRVAIKADETTLSKIQHQLNGEQADSPELTPMLLAVIKETLLATGTTNNFQVELQCAHIVNHHDNAGGLNHEIDPASQTGGYEHLLELINRGDEILCSE